MKGKDLISFTYKEKDDFRRYVHPFTNLKIEKIVGQSASGKAVTKEFTLEEVLNDFETKNELYKKEIIEIQAENETLKADIKELQQAIVKILELVKVGK